MSEKVTAWLRAKVDNVDNLRSEGILRFSLRGSFKNVVIANVINVSLHILLDRAGLLAYPLRPALVVAICSATFITFVISMVVYSMIGQSILALAIQRDDFRRLSNYDQLSGLLNRHAFFALLETPDQPGSLALLDIDHFKSINDEHGHPFGDEVIRGVGSTLTALFQGTDTVIGRIGGEEFGIMLRRRTVVADDDPIEAARHAIADMMVPGLPRSVTVSLGVADISLDRSAADTYLAADRTLYSAKAAGRNRVMREDQLEAALVMPVRSLFPPNVGAAVPHLRS